MSETPRTDRAVARWPLESFGEMTGLARQLERENAALREQLAERDAKIAALKAERDTSVAVTERIKVALRIRGTGSYVEWAAYCRDALEKLERAEAELATLRKQLAERDAEIARLKERSEQQRAERAEAELAKLRQLTAQQAEDDGLWFSAATAPEAYLQQELRKLHAAVEGAK